MVIIKIKMDLNVEEVECAEGTDFMPIKTNKMSINGANKIYTFCLDCGVFDSILLDNTTMFKKK
ncbi:hypothetical protein C2I17_06190 [Niallia circulans]|uniref:hypothetical protein n=1 Tax=Niallia circulans TaxID=1397 RepID=UPI00201D9A1C|nr:hypothetical protein [Niallia circulans]UQZ74197.1 hypothetical protein C2I17_06190 [Niallia circulans]